ncbi:MAG: hypothetical protein HY911_09530 [Desulfobacterales bacterium]|nr:hypothetical protein [Desulfobacterales bacterium]
MNNKNLEIGFFKTLKILEAYLPSIVIGGGWVPFLYSRYLLADSNTQPLFTRDIDLLVKDTLPVIDENTVDQLLTQAGLASIFKTRANPPLIHYQGQIEGCDVEIEFLTDQRGSDSEVVVEVQEGLHAEALRFLSVLVENTITIVLGDLDSPLSVKVPSPAAFILNKGLVFPRRRDKVKKAKDLYYAFDLLSRDDPLRAEIIDGLSSLKQKYPAWFKTFLKNMRSAFNALDSEGVLLVLSQRPSNAYEKLNDDQLKQYVWATFDRFLKGAMGLR